MRILIILEHNADGMHWYQSCLLWQNIARMFLLSDDKVGEEEEVEENSEQVFKKFDTF